MHLPFTAQPDGAGSERVIAVAAVRYGRERWRYRARHEGQHQVL